MTDPKTVLSVPSPADLRQQFLSLCYNDWLGPAGGEDETLYEPTVRDRYLVGMLAPRNRKSSAQERAALMTDSDEDEDDLVPLISLGEKGELATGGIDNEDGLAESPVPEIGDTAAFLPSSLGVTVSLGSEVRQVVAEVRYGRYTHGKDEEDRRFWQRTPVTFVSPPIEVGDCLVPQMATEPDRPITLTGMCRSGQGGFSLTLFLVNNQTEQRKYKDETWLFQPEIVVRGVVEGEPVFARRPLGRQSRDAEDRMMGMLYRRQPEFAVGHGVGVHVTQDPANPARASRVTTKVIPGYEVPVMRPRDVGGLITDMKMLGDLEQGQFTAALAPLVDSYALWLEARSAEAAAPDHLLEPFRKEAAAQVKRGWNALERIRAGIALLDENPQAAQAFRFANQAMHLQRVRMLFANEARRERKPNFNTLDVPANRSWRPFQLAFILLNLPAMTDPTHPERSAENPLDSLVDLLWFPTGGGKTEAYLGLTAFTLAIRRLQPDLGGFDRSGAGVAVIMRYTLRLLTLQQFQRATALICACEVLRRNEPAIWGDEPFRIGLWVGQSSTPNSTEESARVVEAERNKGFYSSGGTPIQLKTCPWCGSAIDPGRNIRVETVTEGAGRTLQYCGNALGDCPFSELHAKGEGLPILVVDEEIYRRLPALIIATVDKFAQMAWKGPVQMLFGRVTGYCPRHGYRSPDLPDEDSHKAKQHYSATKTIPLERGLRPPDLIIQDELHLISGPLGTLVGLYETAVDALCEWSANGTSVRAKVVASTATIRRAESQVNNLFQRKLEIFPPSGLDASDNFFALQANDSPGRQYLGICASGTRLKTVLIRVYVTMMATAQKLLKDYGPKAADPYMTLVGYFNSVRELGGMVRVMDDAVRMRLNRMDKRGLERRPVWVDNIEELTSRKTAADIPYILDRLEKPFGVEGKPNPLDAVLATNMISVGVDVGRLGCMVVAGQPKATAEYIQATSRVGRQSPGVVVTVHNWTRPRDLSHYERFEHYHATFYQQVEALSVTPFAPRAVERALVAVLVALVRQSDVRLNSDAHAGALEENDPLMEAAIKRIQLRADRVTSRSDRVEQAERLLKAARDEWLSRKRAVKLTYNTRKGDQVPLLLPPDASAQRKRFTCLNSMRDVDLPVQLILNDEGMDGWQ